MLNADTTVGNLMVLLTRGISILLDAINVTMSSKKERDEIASISSKKKRRKISREEEVKVEGNVQEEEET